MVSFPLYLALVPFALVLVGVAIMAVVSIGHLMHYGATTFLSFLITFAYLAGSATILFITWQMVQDVDWTQPVEIRLSVPGMPSGGVSSQPML